jgi:16S rRNA (guanine966-N2)-methyltransferase
MRVTAGRLKGRNLVAPTDMRVRPTSDKVRQALFNILVHHDFGSGFAFDGARVIDLFAGTGALAIEALSRGAAYALLVDDSAESRALIRRNVEALGLTGATKIWRRDATQLGPLIGHAFNLAFLDPPYRRGLLEPALRSLRDGRWLTPAALIVAETAEEEALPAIAGYELLEDRFYGDTRLLFLRPNEGGFAAVTVDPPPQRSPGKHVPLPLEDAQD